MPAEKRPTSFRKFARLALAKTRFPQALSACAVLGAAAYLAMMEPALAWMSIPLLAVGAVSCFFFGAHQAWKKEVAQINDLCEAKMEFADKGLLEGDGPFSVVVKNLSKTKTIKKPVVNLISSHPPLIPNLPIRLHQQDDDFNADAKRPDIHPDTAAIFDLIRYEENTGAWKIMGDGAASQPTIQAVTYEMLLVASAEDMEPTRPQRIYLIRSADGKPSVMVLNDSCWL